MIVLTVIYQLAVILGIAFGIYEVLRGRRRCRVRLFLGRVYNSTQYTAVIQVVCTNTGYSKIVTQRIQLQYKSVSSTSKEWLGYIDFDADCIFPPERIGQALDPGESAKRSFYWKNFVGNFEGRVQVRPIIELSTGKCVNGKTSVHFVNSYKPFQSQMRLPEKESALLYVFNNYEQIKKNKTETEYLGPSE
ncbi:MAG: hypothetical protein OXH31_09680 [Gammaproteobacteria bacterium]|nr:hypothetical protein [Gammaproteobacteria bacterium]